MAHAFLESPNPRKRTLFSSDAVSENDDVSFVFPNRYLRDEESKLTVLSNDGPKNHSDIADVS